MRASAATHSSGGGGNCGWRPSFCTVNSNRTAGSEKSDGKPYPAREVSRSRTVIGRSAGTTSSTGLAGVRTTLGDASSGSHSPTGSSSPIRPSSTSIITAAATMGFVIEARRKIESLAIGEAPSTSAEPTASTSTRPPRSTRATAPATDPFPDVSLQEVVQAAHRPSVRRPPAGPPGQAQPLRSLDAVRVQRARQRHAARLGARCTLRHRGPVGDLHLGAVHGVHHRDLHPDPAVVPAGGAALPVDARDLRLRPPEHRVVPRLLPADHPAARDVRPLADRGAAGPVHPPQPRPGAPGQLLTAALPPWLTVRDDGVTVAVKAVPRSRSTRAVGVQAGALRVQIAAPPHEGRANGALCAYLA